MQTSLVIPLYLTPPCPTVFTIELTSHCNHKCVGCGNTFTRDLGHMGYEQWKDILDRLKAHITSLRITGGECTLHPDFIEFVTYCDSLGVPFVIFSNGRWRNPALLIKTLVGLKNLQGVLVSLHGHEPNSYSKFVISSSFDVVLANIRLASQAGIKIGTNTVLTKYNIEYLEDIVKLSLTSGASSVAFSRYYGVAMPEIEPTEAQLYDAIHMIEHLHYNDQRVVFNNCVPLCFTESDMPLKGCTSGFTHCTIDPLGNVRPCTHSPYILGNILHQDIHTIWRSETLQKWHSLIPSNCLTCDRFSACRGGCRATAYDQNLRQDPLMKQPYKQQDTRKRGTVCIDRATRPILRGKLHAVPEVIYLVGTKRTIALADKTMPILETLSGQYSMEEIHKRFGQIAIDFIGSLAIAGLVDLV